MRFVGGMAITNVFRMAAKYTGVSEETNDKVSMVIVGLTLVAAAHGYLQVYKARLAEEPKPGVGHILTNSGNLFIVGAMLGGAFGMVRVFSMGAPLEELFYDPAIGGGVGMLSGLAHGMSRAGTPEP